MALKCNLRSIFRVVLASQYSQGRYVHYIQGQEPEPKIREYFYYIDHQGMFVYWPLWRYGPRHFVPGHSMCVNMSGPHYLLPNCGRSPKDDSKMKNFTSCFKEKKFLQFFFKRIRLNRSGRYQEEFPFISLCGRERNFIRCDDVPIVYTNIVNINDSDFLSYGYAGDLMTTKFIPDKIYMLPSTGRVYHPADEKYGGVGLVKSKLAIEFCKYFEFNNSELNAPTHFKWQNKTYELDQTWFMEQVTKHKLTIRSEPDNV